MISLRRYRVPSRLTRNQRLEQLRKLGLTGKLVAPQPMARVTARAWRTIAQQHDGRTKEALDQGFRCGAGDENRTRMTSLEGWSSAIELHPRGLRLDGDYRSHCRRRVGATGLEPAIFCSQSRRASHYATPRPSGLVRTFATSVGHATAPTNPVDRTCPTEVWPGYACPVGLPRLSVSQARAVPIPSALRSQE